jgi:hypothetical protein
MYVYYKNMYTAYRKSTLAPGKSLTLNDYVLYADLVNQPAYYIDSDPTNPRSSANELITKQQQSSIPNPVKNGGIYGGEQVTGPWANINVVPETHLYLENLASANPPPGAIQQTFGNNRPGNNTIIRPYLQYYPDSRFNFITYK